MVRVECNHEVNDKEGTTFVAAISMGPSERIPIAAIAKGTTTRCEKKYGKKIKKMTFVFIQRKDGLMRQL